jgi:HupE / UreJ protein
MMCGAGRTLAWCTRRGWPFLVALCLLGTAAGAHKAGTTGYASIAVAGQTVRFAMTLPTEGVLSETSQPTLRELAAAIARHVVVGADGAACAGVPGEVRPPSPGRANVEIVVLYACAAPIGQLAIRDDTAAVLGADHHTIADIAWPGGATQVVFERDQREANIAVAAKRPAGGTASTLASYFGIGAEHILLGFDHVLFIVALILPGGSLLSLVGMVTAFTVAHSITLALSVLGIVSLPSQIVEPVIALSIAYVAFENLALQSAPSRRWAVSFLFGLVHGFGFAGALSEVGLPTSGLIAALVGFNLGVEAGQMLIVAVLLPLLLWLQRFTWEPRLAQLSSMAIMVVGLALLAERALMPNM